jgi:hypothetical protein
MDVLEGLQERMGRHGRMAIRSHGGLSPLYVVRFEDKQGICYIYGENLVGLGATCVRAGATGRRPSPRKQHPAACPVGRR